MCRFWVRTVPAEGLAPSAGTVIKTSGSLYRGYPAKRALSAMRKQGG